VVIFDEVSEIHRAIILGLRTVCAQAEGRRERKCWGTPTPGVS